MCVLFLVADARTKRDNNPVRPKNRDKEEALPRFILDSRDREFPNPGTRFGGASVLTDAPSPTKRHCDRWRKAFSWLLLEE